VAKLASKSFEAYARLQIDCPWAAALLQYPLSHARYNRQRTATPVPKNYYNFLKKIPLNNEQALFYPTYITFIERYVADRFRVKVMDKDSSYNFDNYYADKFDFAATVIKDKGLAFVQAKTFLEGVTKGNIDKMINRYDGYVEACKYQEYKQVVQFFRNKLFHLSAGQAAPDFSFTTIDGKAMRLSDLRGKVVYIDFWATWCGPCKKEMPHSQKLKKHFAGNENIEFLYVSTDKNAERWKNYVQDNKLEGLQGLAGAGASAISKAYNISGIPRFVLVDKMGNFVSSNCKRPSNAELLPLLEATLKGK
jgi:thiol-disulfide isomerase/thioredoxin